MSRIYIKLILSLEKIMSDPNSGFRRIHGVVIHFKFNYFTI